MATDLLRPAGTARPGRAHRGHRATIVPDQATAHHARSQTTADSDRPPSSADLERRVIAPRILPDQTDFSGKPSWQRRFSSSRSQKRHAAEMTAIDRGLLAELHRSRAAAKIRRFRQTPSGTAVGPWSTVGPAVSSTVLTFHEFAAHVLGGSRVRGARSRCRRRGHEVSRTMSPSQRCVCCVESVEFELR